MEFIGIFLFFLGIGIVLHIADKRKLNDNGKIMLGFAYFLLAFLTYAWYQNDVNRIWAEFMLEEHGWTITFLCVIGYLIWAGLREKQK